MNIFCFGLSHQTAAVDVRERFAIPQSALPEALARLKTMPGLTEGLIVSTCNRTEFYVTGEFRDTSAPAFFESFYRDFQPGDEAHLFRLRANRCVRHLFQGATQGNLRPDLIALRHLTENALEGNPIPQSRDRSFLG
jgi:glutamyl-tRNA reductase